MERAAIIFFLRNPEKGKVKQRLVRDLGPEKTLGILPLLYPGYVAKSAFCPLPGATAGYRYPGRSW